MEGDTTPTGDRPLIADFIKMIIALATSLHIEIPQKVTQIFTEIRGRVDELNCLLVELRRLSTENSPLKKLLTNNGENIPKYFKFLSGLKLPDCFAGCCSFEEFGECMEHLTGVPKEKFSTASGKDNGEHWFLMAVRMAIERIVAGARFVVGSVAHPTGDMEGTKQETTQIKPAPPWKVLYMDTPVSLKELQNHPRFKKLIKGLKLKFKEIEKLSYKDDQDENECGYIAICSLCHCVFKRDLSSFPLLRLLGEPYDFVKFCNRIIGESNDAAIWLTDENIIKIVYMLKFIQDNFEINSWNEAQAISEVIYKSEQLFTKLQNKRDDLDVLFRSDDGLLTTRLDAILSKFFIFLPDVKFPYQFDGCGTHEYFSKFMENLEHDGDELREFYVILNTGSRMKPTTTIEDESTTIDEIPIHNENVIVKATNLEEKL